MLSILFYREFTSPIWLPSLETVPKKKSERGSESVMEQWIHLSGEITETRAKAEFSGEERWQALLREVKLLDIWVGHLFLTAPFFSFGRQQQGGIGSKGGQRRERVSVDASAPGEMEGIQRAEVQSIWKLFRQIWCLSRLEPHFIHCTNIFMYIWASICGFGWRSQPCVT